MHKGLNPETGGVGRFPQTETIWDSNWNKIGKEEGFSFSPEESVEYNTEIANKFVEMLEYYKNNVSAYFEGSHKAGRDLFSIQVLAILGQLLQDFTYSGFQQELKSSFLTILDSNGLVNSENLDTLFEAQKGLIITKNAFRESAVLAEVKNSLLIQDIIDQLMTNEAVKGPFIQMIEEELLKDSGADLALVHKLSQKIYIAFLEKLKEFKPATFKSSVRGRLPLSKRPLGGLFGAGITGLLKQKPSYALAPDEPSDKRLQSMLKELWNDSEATDFWDAMAKSNGLGRSAGFPALALRFGSGMDSGIANILKKTNVLQQAITAVLNGEDDEGVRTLLQTLLLSENKLPLLDKYTEIMKNILVTFNQPSGQKLPAKDFMALDSVAKIIHDNGLLTICSASGTTVDIILGLVCLMGRRRAIALLRPLLVHLESPENGSEGLQSVKGLEFKRIFSAISFFMQIGHYHSAAEVLAGLLIVARGLCYEPSRCENVKDTFDQLKQLMEEFGNDSLKFLDVSEEDATKIRAATEEFIRPVV